MATAGDPARESIPLPTHDIQGNILTPFGKELVQEFVFLSFRNAERIAAAAAEATRTANAAAAAAADERLTWLLDAGRRARGWLNALVDEIASTVDVEAAKSAGASAGPRSHVVVSFTSAALVTMRQQLAADLVTDDALWTGALPDRAYDGRRRSSAAIVGDQEKSDPKNWAIGAPDQEPIDAMVTIAADTVAELDVRCDRIRRQAEEDFGFAVIPVRLNNGTSALGRRCAHTDGTEPFGFADGISQPGIRGYTAEKFRNGRWESDRRPGKPIIAAGEFVLGYDREPGSYSGGRRADLAPWMKNGSCHVWLQLEQDVDGWRRQTDLLQRASKDGIDVAAKVIGRRRDGTPLAPGPGGAPLPPDSEDFDYDNDPDGVETPIFAHTRKMNPRNTAQYRSRTHRLLRRGIPYAEPPVGDESSVPRGLVFNAYMGSIAAQFEYLLYNWAGNPNSRPMVSDVADGPDALVGASTAPCLLRQRGRNEPTTFPLGRFVATRGAVYLFAPSISTLRMLAQPPEVVTRETDPALGSV